MTRRLVVVVATWFYTGYAPVAPGTAGSLAAWGMAWLAVHCLGVPPWCFGIAALALLPLATKVSHLMEVELGAKDPTSVVVDEAVGQWIALAPAAAGSWEQWGAALVLFRILDIAKPLGIRRLESWKHGVGVVADDVGAGVCAMIGVILVRWIGS